MKLLATLLTILPLISAQASLANLEVEDGGFYLGAWYDRLNGDTPTAINTRLGIKPMAFFQSDINITDTLQSSSLDQIIGQTTAQPHAFIYLTIYPYDGFAAVSESAFAELVTKIQAIVNAGNNVMIRYASEMNGIKYYNVRILVQVWTTTNSFQARMDSVGDCSKKRDFSKSQECRLSLVSK